MQEQKDLVKSLKSKELLEKYGSPLYVYSEDKIRENYSKLKNAISAQFKNFQIFYAVKANNNPAIVSILRSEGCFADCSSPAEIYLAEYAGFNKNQILFTGNFQSDEELDFGLTHSSRFNVDDKSVAVRLLEKGNPDIFCCRINPGVTSGYFEALEIAGPNAKFGMSLDDAVECYKLAQSKGQTRFGIHMMTGSNVLDYTYFKDATERLFEIAIKIHELTGIQFEFINVGGGYGIPYRPDETPLDIEKAFEVIKENWIKYEIDEKLNSPTLYTEPGRYLVCNAGVLLGQVDNIKESFGKTYIGTAIGMNTLLRPPLYKTYHHILVVGKEDAPETHTYQIVGKICENSDFMAKDRSMPEINENDIIAITNAGAYGFSMSSQYNSRPRCAEVLLKNNVDYLIRKAETPESLHIGVNIPSHLK